MGAATISPHVEQLRGKVALLRKCLGNVRGKEVKTGRVTQTAKDLVAVHFRSVRRALEAAGLDDETLSSLDQRMQSLLVLTQKRARRTVYQEQLKNIERDLDSVEVAFITTRADKSVGPRLGLDQEERRIGGILSRLVPSAGASYRQACIDLQDVSRDSYRGDAAELREALRELVHHLAPDEDVMSADGFRLEEGQDKPTMKQRIRFILRSRRSGHAAVSKVAENAIDVLEERLGALARSIYDRSSLSTHMPPTREEVVKVKAYVDVLLGELLGTA